MRPLWLALGIAALASAWLGLLPGLLPGPFSAHMAMHMMVVAVAAPLIALGVAGGRFDPVRAAPWLFAPIPASAVEFLAVWAWHAPALHHVARGSTVGLVLEQGTFFGSGLLVWLSALGGDPHERRARTALGGVALLLTSMHVTLLGALLALPPRPLYAGAGHAHAEHGAALRPLADQHLGGAIMLGVGGVVYLLGGLALAARLLAPAPDRQPRVERGYAR